MTVSRRLLLTGTCKQGLGCDQPEGASSPTPLLDMLRFELRLVQQHDRLGQVEQSVFVDYSVLVSCQKSGFVYRNRASRRDEEFRTRTNF